MSFYSGKDGELYIAEGSGTETKAAKIQSWSFSSSMAVLETTSMADTDRTIAAGVRSYSGSARLFYYTSDISSSSTESNLHKILTNSLGTATTAGSGDNSTTSTPSEIILRLRLTTGTNDKRDIKFSAFITGVSMSMAVGEVASADITWEANGAPFGATADKTLIN